MYLRSEDSLHRNFCTNIHSSLTDNNKNNSKKVERTHTSISEWVDNKMCYSHTIEDHSTTKWNGVMIQATTWVNFFYSVKESSHKTVHVGFHWDAMSRTDKSVETRGSVRTPGTWGINWHGGETEQVTANAYVITFWADGMFWNWSYWWQVTQLCEYSKIYWIVLIEKGWILWYVNYLSIFLKAGRQNPGNMLTNHSNKNWYRFTVPLA